jgi:hypothetical protein
VSGSVRFADLATICFSEFLKLINLLIYVFTIARKESNQTVWGFNNFFSMALHWCTGTFRGNSKSALGAPTDFGTIAERALGAPKSVGAIAFTRRESVSNSI